MIYPLYNLGEQVIFKQKHGERMGIIQSAYLPPENTEWRYGVLVNILNWEESRSRYSKVESFYVLGENEIYSLDVKG